MSTHKHIDKICCIVLALAIILTILFMNGEAIGLSAAENTMGYEERLFNSQAVHTIDIFMDDWDEFVEGCESEEYENCSVVIDNEVYKNVGIRAKGNTSLSQVSSSDSDRYSFKVEFDHYDSTKSYYGLDKLSLNNIIQDNTFMKDYIAYTMMAEYGVDAPLCSFVYITVNGEDWGLYLAVEAVEDSFLQRNYGGEYGELYKPDSMSNGGGRGNGKNFDFSDVEEQIDAENEQSGEQIEEPQKSMNSFDPSQFDQGMVPSEVMPSAPDGFDDAKGQANTVKNDGSMIQGGFGGGMGSNDVKLQYIDDNAESYSDIFDNAKTDITDADKERLISALKNLSENTDIESTVCVDEVICYFVVHNYLCNDDSYTGTMVHNYYLYEKDGMLSMIPWDYNLAFGGFRSKDATETVNSPIDSPVSGGTVSDRPMISWIFENEEYKQLYHEYYDEFISGFFENGRFIEEITSVAEAISPYVEKDPTKFCTFEEFEIAVDTLLQFCELRALSVRGQLEGSVPSTSQGQANDASSLVDAGSINISDMGAMNTGGGKPGDKNSAMQGDVGAMMPGEDSEISNSTENESSSTMPETPNAVRPPMGEGHPGAQQGGAFGGMMGGNMMQGGLNGGMRGDAAMQNTTAQQMPSETVQTQEGPSSKNIVILVICIVLIIGGILLTKKFKR